jgi:hypothetical protein
LLSRGQIEHHVCLDKRFGGFVVEHDFLVDVRWHVFPVELGIEFRGDGGYGHAFCEDEGEGDGFVALLFALFGQGFGAKDLGGWVGGMPGAEEDVVLEELLERVVCKWGKKDVLRHRVRQCI